MKKLSLFLLILLCSVNIFSTPIVSGLGFFYKTPYEEALKQLEDEGFKIKKIENIKDESRDIMNVYLHPFVFNNISFLSGKLEFHKDIDCKYKFCIASCTPNLPKEIDKIMGYVWKLYDTYEDKYLGNGKRSFSGDNMGHIFLLGDDVLGTNPKNVQIVYIPQSPMAL